MFALTSWHFRAPAAGGLLCVEPFRDAVPRPGGEESWV